MKITMLAAASFALLCGCADSMHAQYSRPYVKFEADHNQNLKGLFAATVVGVDGKPISAGDTPPFPPGAHAVQVEWRLNQERAAAPAKTLQIDAKPCTRYYIAGKRAGDGYEPVVSATEPIKECESLGAKSGGM